MYEGVFVKFTSVNFRLEGVVVEEVVIDCIDFATPRGPRRRGDGSPTLTPSKMILPLGGAPQRAFMTFIHVCLCTLLLDYDCTQLHPQGQTGTCLD